MKKDHTTPQESISYQNLVELIVKQLHGGDAIAEITGNRDVVKKKKHRMEVERAGKWIDYFEDCERGDSAKDTIIQACYAGTLVAYVCNETGGVKKIDRQYWDEDSSVVVKREKQYWKNEDKQAPDWVERQKTPYWYALSTGVYQSSKLPTFYNQTVYFKEEEATSFVDTLDGKTATKPTGQKVNKGGRPFADEHNEIAEKIAELKSEGLGYPKILRDIRFTKCVQKLKQDKILESGEIKKEQLYHKVTPSIKGKEYTALVGISIDTVKNMIENPTE